MFSFARHPVFLIILGVVIVCVFAGGAAEGGHVIASWGHDVIDFFHGLTHK
jgi:hypothetical protein